MLTTPIRVYVSDPYLKAGTLKLLISSSPRAKGLIPKPSSGRYPPGEVPGARSTPATVGGSAGASVPTHSAESAFFFAGAVTDCS